MRLNYKGGEESLLGGDPPWRNEHGHATCNINTQICDKHNSKLRYGKEVVTLDGKVVRSITILPIGSGYRTGLSSLTQALDIIYYFSEKCTVWEYMIRGK